LSVCLRLSRFAHTVNRKSASVTLENGVAWASFEETKENIQGEAVDQSKLAQHVSELTGYSSFQADQ